MRRAAFIILSMAALAGWGRAAQPLVEDAWRQSLPSSAATGCNEQAFRAEAGPIAVEGYLRYEPDGQMLRIAGVYRTRQQLDPRAKLSYQLLTEDGHLLQFDGVRSDWRQIGTVVREASFEIEQSLADRAGLRPGIRVRFNYVVEGEFWYRDRHPEMVLPELTVLGPERFVHFSVYWAWIPFALPAGTDCWLPARIGSEYSGAPPPYKAAMDVCADEGLSHGEAPRLALASVRGGRELVFYRLGDMPAGRAKLRPGFVWDGVAWFSLYAGNPYRDVRMVGPLTYSVVLTLGMLALWWGTALFRRVRLPALRRLGCGAIGVTGLLLAALTAVSLQLPLAAGIAAIWFLQRKISAPGPRAYWTTWLFIVLQEVYWGHALIQGGGLWSGTALSVCLAALALLPLHRLRSPAVAGWSSTCVGFVVTLTATALSVYFGYFGDYPGLRDLSYAGQVGETGDSLALLIGQKHMVPWWWWLCCVAGGWAARHRSGLPVCGAAT